jgi:DNA-binding transcriptional ArsR family regulator
MPPRKTEQIVQLLRHEILSGQRAPGARLPTYDAFTEQFGVTRPTVARGMKALRSEGLVTGRGTRGVFVARTLPHKSRYLWVTSERPGTPEWSSLSAALLELVERGETGFAGEVVPLFGVDGRENNPAYHTLCEAVRCQSAAGLIVSASATTALLPALQAARLPAVTVGVSDAEVGLDVDALIDRACARLLARGTRLAVFSPEAAHLERVEASLRDFGLPKRLLTTVHVAPVGCEKVTELLFERTEHPDAVLVADDALTAPLLAGLARTGVRAGRDVRVLARCTWPCVVSDDDGVERLGFDAAEVLVAAKVGLEARREGRGLAPRVVPPRFAGELRSAKPIASAA